MWFIRRARNYPVITFTLAFLFVYRFSTVFSVYFSDYGKFFVNITGLPLSTLFALIPLAYLVQWLVVTWVASYYPERRLREKFYSHPILTLLLAVLYLADGPYRLSGGLGPGIMALFNGFEVTIYWAFIYFLWFLLFAWVSSKFWRKQRFEWHWYKAIVDKFFKFLPVVYKIALGFIVAAFIYSVLLRVVFGLGYSGADLEKLFY